MSSVSKPHSELYSLVRNDAHKFHLRWRFAVTGAMQIWLKTQPKSFLFNEIKKKNSWKAGIGALKSRGIPLKSDISFVSVLSFEKFLYLLTYPCKYAARTTTDHHRDNQYVYRHRTILPGLILITGKIKCEQHCTTALGPTQPPIQCVPGALSLRIKLPGREADHLVPRSKNEWSYTSTPPIRLNGVVLS
jgi:hypothetical protein